MQLKENDMAKNTVLFLNHTDKELEAMRLQKDFDGRMARKEIQRRKLVGFWDGSATVYVDPNAKFVEADSKVGQITINGVVQ